MSRELEHLEEANRHLADAERRVAEQRDRVAELERLGHNTTHSLALLRVFEQTWDLMIAHRNMIRRELEPLFKPSHYLVKTTRTEDEVLKTRAKECSRRAVLTTDPQLRRDLLNFAAQWQELAAMQQELEAWREWSVSGSKASLEILKNRQAWVSGQRQAFEMAMLGRELETTLGF